MSLIDIMLDEISDMTRDDKFVSNEDWRRFLEKHLKQSESKSIDDLIEKFLEGYDNDDRYEIRVEGLKIRLKEFAESLKQSEKVVEMKHGDNCPNCGGVDIYAIFNYCPDCSAKIKWID